MTNWQPIETAPKNAEILVGWRDGAWNMAIAFWAGDYGEEGWINLDWVNGERGDMFPATHWAPIPTPPDELRKPRK